MSKRARIQFAFMVFGLVVTILFAFFAVPVIVSYAMGVTHPEDIEITYIDSLNAINKPMKIGDIVEGDDGLWLTNKSTVLNPITKLNPDGTLERIHGKYQLLYINPDTGTRLLFDKDLNASDFYVEPKLCIEIIDGKERYREMRITNDSFITIQILAFKDDVVQAIVIDSQDNIYVTNGDILILAKSDLVKLSDAVKEDSILGVKFSNGVNYISYYDVADTYYFECNNIEELQEVYNP